MSTQKPNLTGARIALLMNSCERLFHIKDLAVLWNIGDYNTLRTTVKRYSASGLIHRIYKGFYAVVPAEKIDPLLLGAKAIHEYCYLSTESILFIAGYISRKITYHTFVSAKSKRFFIGKNQYLSRQLKTEFLFNPAGLQTKNGILQANLDRAIADMLYFNPKFHFDRKVNWRKIKVMQKKLGYPLTPKRYVNS